MISELSVRLLESHWWPTRLLLFAFHIQLTISALLSLSLSAQTETVRQSQLERAQSRRCGAVRLQGQDQVQQHAGEPTGDDQQATTARHSRRAVWPQSKQEIR